MPQYDECGIYDEACRNGTCSHYKRKVAKQTILEFYSHKRDHAAVWTIYEVMPGGNTDRYENSGVFIQDRDRKWWMVTRDLFNTSKQALKQNPNYFDAVVSRYNLEEPFNG